MSELSFLGLSVPDKKDVNQENQSNDYLMNFEENSSPKSSSINSNMAENKPPANLIDSSFKMADISTDLKDESGIRDDEIKKSIDDEMNHESNVQIDDEKTVTMESTDVSNTSLDKSKDGTLNESIYRYMTSMTQSPPPEIFIVSNDDEGDNQSENNAALSDVGSESFVDAQDEFLDQTLTDHDDNEEDYDEKVSTPTTKSPDHTLTNCKQSLNIDHLNVSPCCTLSNNSTLIKSPKILAEISADDQECSFTYEDRLELLQTKITYEKQIVELHEKLDQQKDDGSVQVSKMQAEQIDHIRKEYDIQCQKSQDQLEQQKNRYETIVGQLEEAMEQLRMSNASMKNQYETNALAQINELKQRHEQLSIKLYESQDENQKLNDCILEMAEQRGHLREKMESLKSNMIELNNRLVESVHERESLKSRLNDGLAVKSTFEGEEKMQNLISDHLEELNKLKLQNDKTITDLQNEINNLNFTIESNLLNMNNLNDQLVLKNKELEKNRHELSKQNEKFFEIETKLKRVECENEKLKLNDQRIEEFETKINDLESKLAELKIENDSLKKDIQVGLTREKKYDVKLNDSKSEISKLMIVNQELSNAKIELEEARSSIENRLFDCEEQNVLLETKLEQIEQQIKQEQEANVNKQVEMVEKITRLEQIVCDKDVELEFLKTNNHRETQELRGKIEQAEMVHCDLQKLYDDFQAKHLNCDHIYDENQRLHNETEKLRKDNKDLNEKWDQFQHEWIESRTKLLAEKDCLQQSNDTMRIKIVELNDMVRESTTKTAALEAELKSGHEQLRNKLNETSQRLVETERVKSELESKNSIILEKNKKIVSEFASTEKRFCEERSLMEQKISALQKRLRMTEAERESLDKERLSLEKNLQTLQSNMEQMQTKISERDDEFNRCQNELGQQRKHIQSQQEQTNVLKEECENLKKSNTEIQQRLQRNRERYDENFNTMRQVAHKYLVAKTLIPTLQNQIKLQKEVGEKLTNEIAVLLAKVDSNKKDSIKNEKVKEILRLINDRISNLAKDTTLLIGTHSKQDPVIDANAGPRVAEGKEQMPPPQSTSTKSAFEPIELPSTDDRPKTTTKSLNVSNKENIL
ncbi:uncharacterized protein LOC113790303 [Dermatophagoides pteronyssinus]|uniref:uncharacterized protein LOC113790303 n=1 Tax=Dermatophagoides pteronyssinus TaxID=6956 RepID=UPI003F6791FA